MRVAIALALAVSTAAAAECKKNDFDRYLAAAVRLYEALEYERALDSIAKAKESSCGVDDDAKLGLYEGIVRGDLGQADQAKVAFKEALLLKPDAEIPLKVSPKVKKQIELLRAEAKKELAPILARQEEERRKKVAEENERNEKARREEEGRRAEEQRRADDARRAAEDAKAGDARRAEEQRRLDEQRRARPGEPPVVIVVERDRPENRTLTVQPTSGTPDDTTTKVEVKRTKSTPVVPFVLGGLGFASMGVGFYFGFYANQWQREAAMITDNQVTRSSRLNQANDYAIAATALWIGAGVCAVVALLTAIAMPSETVTEPAK